MTMPMIAMKSDQERKALLAQTLQGQIVSGGRVESQSDFQAVLVRGQRVNHVLHFLIGLLTLGIWWVVWLIMAVAGGEKRSLVSVDEFGHVSVQQLTR